MEAVVEKYPSFWLRLIFYKKRFKQKLFLKNLRLTFICTCVWHLRVGMCPILRPNLGHLRLWCSRLTTAFSGLFRKFAPTGRKTAEVRKRLCSSGQLINCEAVGWRPVTSDHLQIYMRKQDPLCNSSMFSGRAHLYLLGVSADCFDAI